MLGKLEEDYLESQNKLNLSELYNNEEIKLLKKSIPDINNMIYLAANSELNSTKDSKIFNERVNPHQFQYRYFPPTRKIKSTNNNSFYIDKEKFFTLILEKTKQFLRRRACPARGSAGCRGCYSTCSCPGWSRRRRA